MLAYVGVTDFDWFTFLSSQPGIEEVNFWKPGGQQGFGAVPVGAPFLFKLHSPRNVIAGGGFFVHFTRLPTSLAWEAFEIKNGATSLLEMRRRIEKYRKVAPSQEDYSIGCIVLGEPFFFREDEWIPIPSDWAPNIVSGRTYDLRQSPGQEMWEAVQARLASRSARITAERVVRRVAEPLGRRYGDPIEVLPRLGQGSFRVLVTDAYGRRCAMTGERTLPVLDAVHIRSYAAEGEHRVQNGLLLRSDLHRLFDRGYLTVRPNLRIEVSIRIREEFENGRDYYALSGREIRVPERAEERPDLRALEWHADTLFRV
jgi:putative restriction endonuclease